MIQRPIPASLPLQRGIHFGEQQGAHNEAPAQPDRDPEAACGRCGRGRPHSLHAFRSEARVIKAFTQTADGRRCN